MRNTLPAKTSSIRSDIFPLLVSPEDLPVFKTLGARESEAVLVRNSVGSIAFARGGRVEIIPIHYVYLNGWIHGRTASPSDLPSNASVAFQVDEHRGSDHWRTVVVQGRLDLVDSVEQPRGLYRRVTSFVRDLVRRTPVEAAPVLFRDLSFAVRPIQISGRVSLPRDWKELAS